MTNECEGGLRVFYWFLKLSYWIHFDIQDCAYDYFTSVKKTQMYLTGFLS